MNEQGAFLADWVLPKFRVRQWVISFPIQLRFWMAKDSELLSRVLSIVIRAISGFQRRKGREADFKFGESGAVTLVQRFGGALNLNIHFHILFLEALFRDPTPSSQGDQRIEVFELEAPTTTEVGQVLERIAARIRRHLKMRGYPIEDGDAEPTLELGDLDDVQAASVEGKIAQGERAGRGVRRIGSFGEANETPTFQGPLIANLGGFSLHAATAIEGDERNKLEKLCRYITRPPIAESRLRQADKGGLVYRFRKAWNDGSKGIYLSPEELIEKLVALVPPPRKHLTRFHGVLGPHHRLRARVVPTPPDEEPSGSVNKNGKPVMRDPRRLRWAELLKRVFDLDLTTCPDCGGKVRFIAAIEERKVIVEILTHLRLPTEIPEFHQPRAPPQGDFWESP